jgi:flavin reductase (DIM6/NTAB) family NADH-FMN oxidoreductase RutF
LKQKEVVPAGGGWLTKNIAEFPGSPGQRIGAEWMLITAGDLTQGGGNWNTMTASWGGLGTLWSRDVAFMFIRPSRHTFGFANQSPVFTLSFFGGAHHEALVFCGEKSGRDTDKAGETGLTPIVFDETVEGAEGASVIGFQEAREIIICRKLYTHDFDPARFLDPPSIEKAYQGKDYHRLFIGEITGFKVRP